MPYYNRKLEHKDIPADDPEPADELDREYKVITVRLVIEPESEGAWNHEVEELLRAGWWIYDKIVCPPFVQYIFEKDLGRRLRRRHRRNP